MAASGSSWTQEIPASKESCACWRSNLTRPVSGSIAPIVRTLAMGPSGPPPGSRRSWILIGCGAGAPPPLSGRPGAQSPVLPSWPAPAARRATGGVLGRGGRRSADLLRSLWQPDGPRRAALRKRRRERAQRPVRGLLHGGRRPRRSSDDPEFRAALRAYMEWAVGEFNRCPDDPAQVPAGLATPRWGWGGLLSD
jgi:hypothetical protein